MAGGILRACAMIRISRNDRIPRMRGKLPRQGTEQGRPRPAHPPELLPLHVGLEPANSPIARPCLPIDDGTRTLIPTPDFSGREVLTTG